MKIDWISILVTIIIIIAIGFVTNFIRSNECAMPDIGNPANSQWYCPSKCTCSEYETIKDNPLCQTPACDNDLRCINWGLWCIYKWR